MVTLFPITGSIGLGQDVALHQLWTRVFTHKQISNNINEHMLGFQHLLHLIEALWNIAWLETAIVYLPIQIQFNFCPTTDIKHRYVSEHTTSCNWSKKKTDRHWLNQCCWVRLLRVLKQTELCFDSGTVITLFRKISLPTLHLVHILNWNSTLK